ncbi:Putative peptidoglycan O-acetyltransferase yrhL [Actinoplanes sp. SE50]|uniref:acyltransferase family protein n=1 Tax=unclassified Actinoplanes TaxID=2626549 RepID=UPI00023ECF21|nr:MULTISPECIES: acyltransferase [unclassified Actinoplanes]AEV86619.1 Putative peptidoglycan O-acetyltransferase yrhL [Actinoplanes sp. SE50/110]ATO85017.1 Putative peptidoglycan O-acetyltransferase yrhL [Actinoplanes sp. SE50]SLM02426.1 acyltransferase [Actinoplanes sp. SE50/110]
MAGTAGVFVAVIAVAAGVAVFASPSARQPDLAQSSGPAPLPTGALPTVALSLSKPYHDLWPDALVALPLRLPDGRRYSVKAELGADRYLLEPRDDQRRYLPVVFNARTGVTRELGTVPTSGFTVYDPAGTYLTDHYIAWVVSAQETRGAKYYEVWSAPRDGGTAVRRATFGPDEMTVSVAEVGGVFYAGTEPAEGAGAIYRILGGAVRYARRRARRILPVYWAALATSALIAAIVPSLPLSAPPTLRSTIVYALLLQDALAAPAPNGAFWSIAVEAGLYLAFPLVLVARRRCGATVTLAAVTVPVITAGLLLPELSLRPRAIGYTLELAPLFTMGVLAAGIVSASDRVRRLPWLALAGMTGAPVLMVIVLRGSAWAVVHYYWLDLAVGPAIGLFLAALATRRPLRLTRLLNGAPLRKVGGFSYSLYLIHMPIVALISTLLVGPRTGPHLTTFIVTTVLVVPICLATVRLFAAVFEIPFQRCHRRRESGPVHISNASACS